MKEKEIESRNAMYYVIKYFFMALTIAILGAILSGCSDRWIVNKGIKRGIILTDTVVKYDTIIIEVSEIDTLFRYQFDTVEYWQDSVFVKYHYDTITKDVYLEVDCPDCEEVTKTIQLPPVIKKESFWKKLEYFGSGIIFLGFVLILLRLFRR